MNRKTKTLHPSALKSIYTLSKPGYITGRWQDKYFRKKEGEQPPDELTRRVILVLFKENSLSFSLGLVKQDVFKPKERGTELFLKIIRIALQVREVNWKVRRSSQ